MQPRHAMQQYMDHGNMIANQMQRASVLEEEEKEKETDTHKNTQNEH